MCGGGQSGSLGCVRCGRISFGLENLASDYKAIEYYQKFLSLSGRTLTLGKRRLRMPAGSWLG